jgi:hypothetical protein
VSSSTRDQGDPVLVMSPFAWLKWQYLCHAGPTEVSAFGVTAADDPLYVEALAVPKQECSGAYTDMDADSIAALTDAVVDQGMHPSQFGRVWLHTHPGDSAEPSGTDEKTLTGADGLGGCDHAVMAILARGGEVYCRLRVKRLDVEVLIPVKVDWERFPRDLETAGGLPHDKWLAQYLDCVTERKWAPLTAWEKDKNAGYKDLLLKKNDRDDDRDYPLVSYAGLGDDDFPRGDKVKDHYPADVVEMLGLDPEEPWDPEDDEWVMEYLDDMRREDFLAANQTRDTLDTVEDLADKAQENQ